MKINTGIRTVTKKSIHVRKNTLIKNRSISFFTISGKSRFILPSQKQLSFTSLFFQKYQTVVHNYLGPNYLIYKLNPQLLDDVERVQQIQNFYYYQQLHFHHYENFFKAKANQQTIHERNTSVQLKQEHYKQNKVGALSFLQQHSVLQKKKTY